MDSWHLWILTCPNPAHGRISGVSTISRVNTYNLSRSNWWQNIKVILLPPVPQESSFYTLRANQLFILILLLNSWIISKLWCNKLLSLFVLWDFSRLITAIKIPDAVIEVGKFCLLTNHLYQTQSISMTAPPLAQLHLTEGVRSVFFLEISTEQPSSLS